MLLAEIGTVVVDVGGDAVTLSGDDSSAKISYALDRGLILQELQDRRLHLDGNCRAQDELTIAPAQPNRHEAEHGADDDRGNRVKDRIACNIGQGNANDRNESTHGGYEVFKKHRDQGRVAAGLHELPEALLASARVDLFGSDREHIAFDENRQAKHPIGHPTKG